MDSENRRGVDRHTGTPGAEPDQTGRSFKAQPVAEACTRFGKPGRRFSEFAQSNHLSALPDKSKREVADAAHEGVRR